MSALRICVVYPDLLGTYGDGGNGEILARRTAWRGTAVELLAAPSSQPLPVADLYCLGGGEDGPQVLAAERLLADGGLSRAVEAGAAVLAVCAGYQIAGEHFPDAQGVERQGLGLLGITTSKGKGPRAVGELVAEVPGVDEGGLGLGLLSGFENHGGITRLAPSTKPLARVRVGIGNGAGDASEGAVNGRVVGTYLHGPVLARNPELADQLLCWAMGREDLEPLDDSIALDLRAERLRAVSWAKRRAESARRR
jgi:CobQ-like glutamine amidotransferase family enzyme